MLVSSERHSDWLLISLREQEESLSLEVHAYLDHFRLHRAYSPINPKAAAISTPNAIKKSMR
jgi:hypothetical protein